MRSLIFEQSAFDDFFDWGVYDKRIFLKIHDLLKAILRDPFKGPGKPEPLRGMKGFWSRRIDDKHRLDYPITSDGDVEVISCKGHYGDRKAGKPPQKQDVFDIMEKKLKTVPIDAMTDRHIGKRGTPDSREAILAKVRQGLEEISQIEQGKLKGRPAQQLLDEL